MTEEEARAWLQDRDVPRGTIDRLAQFARLVLEENGQQNLISKTTEPHIWARHIVDSAQLFFLASDSHSWHDLGSGPGFPGIVIAILSDSPITLIEPRRRRVEFLHHMVDHFALSHVVIDPCRAEQSRRPSAQTLTARAYAPLDRIFASAQHLATSDARWVLPKGRNAVSELEATRKTWHGVFHVEQSVTDRDSSIIVATQVRRREAP